MQRVEPVLADYLQLPKTNGPSKLASKVFLRVYSWWIILREKKILARKVTQL